MTYLLDSDVLIDYFKEKDPFASLVKRLIKEEQVAISVLSITELRTGWTEEQASYLLPRLYKLFAVEAVLPEIAVQAGMWRREYRQQGKPLTTSDTIIAATTFLKDYCLVTNNTKDYPMPQLKRYHQ
jgi:predicted nucleic acid-binding protein